MNPVILKEFASEVEARVVESFLIAQGYDVKLLDTFAPVHHRYRDGKFGYRLLVREDEVEKIRALLEEHLKSAHLSVIENDLHAPKARSAFGRFLAFFLSFLGMS